MSDLSDYAATVISHNRLIGGEQRLAVVHGAMLLQLSAIVTRFSDGQTVEITLADAVFDPQRQISRKFFWYPERLI